MKIENQSSVEVKLQYIETRELSFIKVESIVGSTIWDSIRESMALAKMLRCAVQLHFNTIVLDIYASSTFEAVVAMFDKSMESIQSNKKLETIIVNGDPYEEVQYTGLSCIQVGDLIYGQRKNTLILEIMSLDVDYLVRNEVDPLLGNFGYGLFRKVKDLPTPNA